jgi:fermentation-respiration switch protein FrsA (DUF1100 family)
VHARDDTVVDFGDARRLVDAAAEPKRLVALEEGGHLLAPRDAAEAALTAIIDWFDRTL